jgi:hypothetical protein
MLKKDIKYRLINSNCGIPERYNNLIFEVLSVRSTLRIDGSFSYTIKFICDDSVWWLDEGKETIIKSITKLKRVK